MNIDEYLILYVGLASEIDTISLFYRSDTGECL